MSSTFRDLHQPGTPFLLANVWDRGSARILAGLGAKALATSSAAHAFTMGLPDNGQITRDEALAHAQDIVSATRLPVQGDFENGFGEAPDFVAQTVRMSAKIGLAGICVEDTALPNQDPYDFDLAVERVRAGAAAARAAQRDFVFCARADGLLTGRYSQEEAIRRIRAFDAAGADVLYAPIPKSMQALAEICSATSKPVNALAAGKFTKVPMADFAIAGVARVSLGSSLARKLQATLIDSARTMLASGDFSILAGGASFDDVDALLESGKTA